MAIYVCDDIFAKNDIMLLIEHFAAASKGNVQ